jgi:hypothetical protein
LIHIFVNNWVCKILVCLSNWSLWMIHMYICVYLSSNITLLFIFHLLWNCSLYFYHFKILLEEFFFTHTNTHTLFSLTDHIYFRWKVNISDVKLLENIGFKFITFINKHKFLNLLNLSMIFSIYTLWILRNSLLSRPWNYYLIFFL